MIERENDAVKAKTDLANLETDSSYALKSQTEISRAKKIFKKTSLREAFLIKEILKKPLE